MFRVAMAEDPSSLVWQEGRGFAMNGGGVRDSARSG